MNNEQNFFEGKDFSGGVFKALTPSYYPKQYQDYIKQEEDLIVSNIKSSDVILEAGVGTGRIIPKIAPLARKVIGIDNADLMIKYSTEIAKKYPNVKIVKCEIENIGNFFGKNYFDKTFCIWNTLGNVESEVEVLKNLSKVTRDRIFITVYKKGTLEERKNWYKTVGIKLKKIDDKNEIFYSESGLKSKSYNEEDLADIAEQAGLKVVEIQTLNNVILWAVFKH